ncbi:hypothetical protein Psuf_009400 [Phytohabitans suffuscus]|uniref:Uncharacterized protein n=1 Tax=Phytohabitans suffuscus TaxID=624315 RepID=A0A6F8YC30_9ACTN|nr:hypothetical protein Psuf_009400 [Phytohabitans suffuscus]
MREDQLRDAGAQGGHRGAGTAVVDDRGGAGEQVVEGDPADRVDVRRQGAQRGQVGVGAQREQEVGVDVRGGGEHAGQAADALQSGTTVPIVTSTRGRRGGCHSQSGRSPPALYGT